MKNCQRSGLTPKMSKRRLCQALMLPALLLLISQSSAAAVDSVSLSATYTVRLNGDLIEEGKKFEFFDGDRYLTTTEKAEQMSFNGLFSRLSVVEHLPLQYFGGRAELKVMQQSELLEGHFSYKDLLRRGDLLEGAGVSVTVSDSNVDRARQYQMARFFGPTRYWFETELESVPTLDRLASGDSQTLSDGSDVTVTLDDTVNATEQSLPPIVTVRRRFPPGSRFNGIAIPSDQVVSAEREWVITWGEGTPQSIVYSQTTRSPREEVRHSERQVLISNFSVGEQVPDTPPDRQISIPDGTTVYLLSARQIDAEWSDGAIRRRFPDQSTELLAKPEFQASGRSKWPITALCLAAATVVGIIVLRNRQQGAAK